MQAKRPTVLNVQAADRISFLRGDLMQISMNKNEILTLAEDISELCSMLYLIDGDSADDAEQIGQDIERAIDDLTGLVQLAEVIPDEALPLIAKHNQKQTSNREEV